MSFDCVKLNWHERYLKIPEYLAIEQQNSY